MVESRGFAFIAFCKHSDAIAALLCLKKADAVFGSDRSAKVAFVQAPIDPTDEIMSQVKTVYVEALDGSWDEEKLKIVCGQYGDIKEVKFSKDLHNNRKRRNFGFLTFKTRENALACVQGLNKDQSGGVKVKTNLARPHCKGGLQSQRAFGGFKVEKDNTVAVAPSNDDSRTIVLSKKRQGRERRSTGTFRVHKESAVDVRSSQNSPAKVSSKKQKGKMKPSLIIREESSTSKNESRGKRKPAQTGRDMDGLVSKSIKYKRKNLSLKPLGPRKQSKLIFKKEAHPRDHGAPHAGYIKPVAGNRSRLNTGYSIPSVGVRYPQAAYYDSYGKLVTASYDIGRTGRYEVVDRLQPTHGGSVHASAYASTQAYLGYTGSSSYVPTSYYHTGPSSSAYPPY
ncbi:Polyadenylate-binding protein, cytoplasmic and nuclear-like protein [Drosera capensis]